MKRDLSAEVDVESQLETQLVSSSVRVPGDVSSCNGGDKRFKASKVNGFIVYSRLRKSNGDRSRSKLIKRIRGLDDYRIDVENGVSSSFDKDQECRVADSVIEEVPVCNGTVNKERRHNAAVVRDASSVKAGVAEQALIKCSKGSGVDEPWSEVKVVKLSQVLERDRLEVPIGVDDEGFERHRKKLKRLTQIQPTLDKFQGETVEVLVNGLEEIDTKAVSSVKVEMIDEGSPLSPPKKNLELKMSKKIALDNVPMTVKELFETGLLEGVPVVYMGGKKAFGLQGMIKDAGILCFCGSCNGCRVIPPSQFEIHAIKQYRRAAQYICFENGKSLLDVLNICRASPLESLEATLQSAISGLPKERTFTCKRCKGTFPTSCVGKVGPLCNTCAESKQSHGGQTCEIILKASSAEPVKMESSRTDSLLTPFQDIDLLKKEKNLRRTELDTSTSKGASVKFSFRKKPHWKILSKSSELDSIPCKVPGDVCSRKTKQCKSSSRNLRLIPTWKSLKSMQKGVSPKNCQSRIMTKRDQRLHRLVFEKGGLPDGTELAYYARGQKLLVGYKRDSGILCRCCNCEVSPSTFEAHAGWATRKKPYAYIYTSDGVSLHELAISLSRSRRYSAKDNDDLCILCGDGGNLVLCDGCPRAFHKGCASLSRVPDGDWYCQFCDSMFQRERFVEYNTNAVAAGRVEGVDLIEQITKRCIRIMKNIELDHSGCVLCRGHDFSRSGFGPRTIILCDQCEKEFHVGCLRSHKIANLKELPKGKWFCCPDCSKIHTNLHEVLVHGAEQIPDSLLHIVKKKHEEKILETFSNIDLKWRLLNGKVTSPESKLLLSQAHAIFQECFDPIMDPTSGRDLIPLMVYGKNSKGQDYGGMHCAVLTVNSHVVSAGILRIFGQEVAELPLVATSNDNHGKGYFQLLFSCIEKLLGNLNVQNLVLPAAEEAESIWIDKFGFQKLRADQVSKYRRSCCQMLIFEGTSMLQKNVPPPPPFLNSSRNNNYSIL